MTYTTVYKDYEAPTLAEAAELMLRDVQIWEVMEGQMDHGPSKVGSVKGRPTGYAVESWEWSEERHTLRVNFR